MGTRSTKALSPVQRVVVEELMARGPFEIPGWPFRSWAYRGKDMVIFRATNPGRATYSAMVKAGLIKMEIPAGKVMVVKLGADLHGTGTAIVRRGRCFKCNGTGELCQQCGEAEGACVCRGGFAGYDCDDCGGTGK